MRCFSSDLFQPTPFCALRKESIMRFVKFFISMVLMLASAAFAQGTPSSETDEASAPEQEESSPVADLPAKKAAAEKYQAMDELRIEFRGKRELSATSTGAGYLEVRAYPKEGLFQAFGTKDRCFKSGKMPAKVSVTEKADILVEIPSQLTGCPDTGYFINPMTKVVKRFKVEDGKQRIVSRKYFLTN